MKDNMKNDILSLGSIIAAIILVLASFPSVVGFKTLEIKNMTQQRLKEIIIEMNWYPSYFIFGLFFLFFILLVSLLGPIPPT